MTGKLVSSASALKFSVPEFHYAHNNYWYPGHMAKTKRLLQDKYFKVADTIVEVRDCRLVTTSVNLKFERSVERWGQTEHKRRIVVYNKSDLVDPSDLQYIKSQFKNLNKTNSLFLASSKCDKSLLPLLNEMRSLPKVGFTNAVVVGMPNVGKSSIINALRRIGVNRGKAASVAPTPGHTRAFASPLTVSDSGTLKVYVIDSPGVMDPEIRNPVDGLKLALVNCTKDSLLPMETIASYLLYQMNTRQLLGLGEQVDAYTRLYNLSGPVQDVYSLAPHVALKYGLLKRGGILDTDRAMHRFVADYRALKFGRWSLDRLQLRYGIRDPA